VRRLLVGGVIVAATMAGAAAGCGVAQSAGDGSASATSAAPTGVTSLPTTTGVTSMVPTTSTPQTPPPSPPRPAVTRDYIHYGARRQAEMTSYARRHYGISSDRVHPRVVVLHFTDSGPGSYPGVHALFDANRPNGGELPGVCAQFVVDQDGTIYQQVPLKLMCRHAIGLNDRAIGIEMIQQQGSSSHWADQQILHRRPQIRSVLRLVRWLQARYDIAKRNVIGHAMANDSPFFHDREGWRNDHTDWQREDVLALRRRL
jgi:N-acetylmuramoyl-L-alanine amidase